MSNLSEWQTWVALYAAIVATGALALEVRRWFESGVRLRISLMPNAKIIGEESAPSILLVTVSNIGDRSTTITHLGFASFDGVFWWWKRWRNRSKNTLLVPKPELPGHPPAIPHVLEPGKLWMGSAIWESIDQWAAETKGHAFVTVYGSHSTKPAMARIPLKIRRVG